MNTQAPATPTTPPYLSLVDASVNHGPALSQPDRAEIGERVLGLLWGLHVAGDLRARADERPVVPRLQVELAVPGTGDLVVQVWQVDGAYELAISHGPWEEMVVLRSPGGRLETLYREHFCSRAEHEMAAKERLVQGINDLMFVQTWGIRHHA